MHAGILFPLFTLAASRPPARGRAAHLEPKLALMSVYYVFTPRGHYTAARSCLALRLSRTRGDGLPHAGARGGTELLRAGLPHHYAYTHTAWLEAKKSKFCSDMQFSLSHPPHSAGRAGGPELRTLLRKAVCARSALAARSNASTISARLI